jgi:hypothetical protein
VGTALLLLAYLGLPILAMVAQGQAVAVLAALADQAS